ncbi:MAG: glycosyltransferase family 2 protein [Chloroflexi bacterium]|nr:glycosyltransferase family 2 protein [Chloroflexota bacterium]
MVRLSAIVITKNEQEHIQGCLESVTWADEMIVLDSFSQDNTVTLSGKFTPQVYQRSFTTFPQQRNAALALARGDWVLFLDADERVTPSLAVEIQAILASPAYPGYWVPRRNIILNKWIRHAGWFPDYQLRLFRRELGRYDEGQEVHERVLLEGPAGHLENPLLHYNYQSFGQIFHRQSLYAPYEARSLFNHGIRAKPHHLLLQPLRQFRRRYIQWQGYKDGSHGLFLSLLMAWYDLMVWTMLAKMAKPH